VTVAEGDPSDKEAVGVERDSAPAGEAAHEFTPTDPLGSAQPPIGDYGFVSDCHSAALIDRAGTVAWWCVPRFDSPSVFGRLLDADAGYWSMRPTAAAESTRSYVGDTLVLRTVFRTDDGEVAVTDALALQPGARGHDLGVVCPHVLIRQVEGLSGRVAMKTTVSPRMEYGRTTPHVRVVDGGVEFGGGPVRLTLRASSPIRVEGASAHGEFTVAAGDTAQFLLTYRPAFGSDGDVATGSVEETLATWQSWVALHCGYGGRFAAQVRRSSLVLQGLTFQPSGAVVAAATTSLPETLGGSLNFDYRYAWLRDLSLTAQALWVAACPTEPGRMFDWFAQTAGHVGDEAIQIMYAVDGQRDLSEHTLEHLGGYRGSRPVRVGNDAWSQTQLDVYGEVLDAAHLLRDNLGPLDRPVQELLVALANRVAATWMQPDAGMWEARDRKRHYLSSKVMCWVALDRAVRLAPRLGAGADPTLWAVAADAVRAAILARGWSDSAGAFTGAFDSDDLDASVLLMPLVGFLPATDERMLATIEAVERRLGSDGLVRRWPGDDSGFVICTFWLVECLALAGKADRAEKWFADATGYANDLGLLAEEGDPTTGELLGNYPQAFSHVGLINAAWRLSQPAATPAHLSATSEDKP